MVFSPRMPLRTNRLMIGARPCGRTLRIVTRIDAGWLSTHVIVVPSVAWLRRPRADLRLCETAKRRGVIRTRVIRSFFALAAFTLAAALDAGAAARRTDCAAWGACCTSGWP